jgi:fructosamine-3-kinase
MAGMKTSMWQSIAEKIGQATGEPFAITDRSSIGGGCINQAFRISNGERSYFVKLNSADGLEMFEAERDGLAEMAATATIKVPAPVAVGNAEGSAWLVMEYIPMGGGGDAAAMGEQLAAMHQHMDTRFGWYRNNTIGSTPQHNDQSDNWVDFLREARLGYQLRLAEQHGIGRGTVRQGERLLESLDVFFTDYIPEPSLLHGDLWGGNAGFDSAGNPVIFDPAVYYGDREADIAMTELFGGFGAQFQAGYNNVWHLDAGYTVRKTLYNLYHILNHYNLFGGSYAMQADRMMSQLLAKLG